MASQTGGGAHRLEDGFMFGEQFSLRTLWREFLFLPFLFLFVFGLLRRLGGRLRGSGSRRSRFSSN
jgi:hypothetical protein